MPLADPDSEPVPFPDDFPERLSAENVEAAIAEAIADGEVEASVESTDCAAFPCMVRGIADTHADISRLKGLLNERYPDDRVSSPTSTSDKRISGDLPLTPAISARIAISDRTRSMVL